MTFYFPRGIFVLASPAIDEDGLTTEASVATFPQLTFPRCVLVQNNVLSQLVCSSSISPSTHPSVRASTPAVGENADENH
jgi:hypothetical protein